MGEKDETQSKEVKLGLILKAAGIELLVFFLVIFIDRKLITQGRMYHYLFLWGMMLWLWGQLPQGELTKKNQLIVFVVIPFAEFLIVQLCNMSNWVGFGFIIIYCVLVAQINHIDLNDGGSSSGRGGGFTGKVINSAIKGLTK